ncbi:hypothetical protein VCHA53O466_320051 [Vibrio chagasii]|nr:hypothetical protein VCHA53O466_320051 [Vibrio chagasii]
MISNLQILKDNVNEIIKLELNEINLIHSATDASRLGVDYLPILVNWYVKFGKVIDNLSEDINQQSLIAYITDYLNMCDHKFGAKYGAHRHEAPFVILSVLIIKGHYAFHFERGVINLRVSERPFEFPVEYRDVKAELFDTACPDLISIKLPFDGNVRQEDSLIVLTIGDDNNAHALIGLLDEATPLNLKELDALDPELKRLGREGVSSHLDATLVAKVVKTAMHHDIYKMHPLKVSGKQSDDVLAICLPCLKAYGLKKVCNSNCAH